MSEVKKIENRFRVLERHARRVSDYFNPVHKYRNQHPFITDLQEDFKEDSDILSLNKYLYVSKLPDKSEDPSEISSEKSIKPKILGHSTLSRPRRKQIQFDFMQETKVMLQYKGVFSVTPLQPKLATPKAQSQSPVRPRFSSWAEGITEESPTQSIDSSFFSQDLESRQGRSYPECISSDYIKNAYEDINRFSSKNSYQESSSPSDSLSANRESSSMSSGLIIKYQTDPNIEIKASRGIYDLIITDLVTWVVKEYHKVTVDKGYILVNKSRKINLENEFLGCFGNVFEIVLKGEGKPEVFYVSLNKFNKESEQNTIRAIKKARDSVRISKKDQVKLPRIVESEVKQSEIKKDFQNPITEALMKYRNKGKLYKPSSYLAKLSSFEGHDFIANKYSKSFI